MEFVPNKRDRKLIKAANKLIQRWSKHLCLDPLWTINVEVMPDEEMEGALARIDTSTSEYYVSTMEINQVLLQVEDNRFIDTVNEIVCHELIHLVMIDFFRTAQIAAGKKEEFQKELKYKYEQFTSRFQRAFIDMDRSLQRAELFKTKLDELKAELKEKESSEPEEEEVE
jgi:hypothetical protein